MSKSIERLAGLYDRVFAAKHVLLFERATIYVAIASFALNIAIIFLVRQL